MNNNITEDYVSFEVAKLLKEKEFRIWQPKAYAVDYFGKVGEVVTGGTGFQDSIYVKPTHALAIKWIRENFGIHITTYAHDQKWCVTIEDISEKGWIRADGSKRMMPRDMGSFNVEEKDCPEEATEAALLYTLKNLIP